MRGVAAYIDKLVFLAISLCLFTQSLIAQQTSKDNYSGIWTDASSWTPVWTVPLTDINGFNVNIYGLITSNGSLSFSGSEAVLTVYDTLVVAGDLVLSNNSQIIVENNGVLIVRGNLTMENQGRISANSYLIVTGNFIKTGSVGQGAFTSDDNPVRVFIGGTTDPLSLNDNVNYPVLNCTSPPTTPYLNSGCSYGNLSDLALDQIYPFYSRACGTATAGSNSPVCAGSSLNLTASGGGIIYKWTGPDGFSSDLQNPVVLNTSVLSEGEYTVSVTFSAGCTATASANVVVNPVPRLVVSNPAAVCAPAKVNLTAPSVTSESSADLTFSYWINSEATIALPAPEASNTGVYYIKGTSSVGCYTIKPVLAEVAAPLPVTITSSSMALCLNDRKLLTGIPEGGSFTVASGPGNISGNVLTATTSGNVNIIYTYSGVCKGMATQTVHFFDMPVSSPGTDQELKNVFETQMNARLGSSQVGEWSLVSGSGMISDIHSPYARITEMVPGENVFRWKVNLGSCESVDEVKITVLELFIPSVITPNGDGKNDSFTVYSLHGPTELIIINRWGMAEYSNSDYRNDWDGKNNKGSELPDDTYMYILKFEDGLIKKGTVLIKR